MTPLISFLKGDISAEHGQGSQDFAQSVERMMAGEAFALVDLETGCQKRFKPGNSIGIEKGKEALSPMAGEILLGGIITKPLADNPWKIVMIGATEKSSKETHIISRLFEEMTECVNNGGKILGHNILGFDLPYMATRASELGLAVPPWLSRAITEWRPEGVHDTLRHYESGRHVHTGISLADLAILWKRPFQSFGASFGDLWAKEDLRRLLMAYNCWNLRDSAALYLFLNGGTPVASAVRAQGDIPQSEPWMPSFGYEALPAEALPSEPTELDVNAAFWLVSPRPGLLTEGPSVRKGWAQRLKEDTRLHYPHHAGRFDPMAVRIVGLATAGPSGAAVVFQPQDEVSAILQSVDLLASIGMQAPIMVESKSLFDRFLRLRLSRYAGLLSRDYEDIPFIAPANRDLLDKWGSTVGFPGLGTTAPAYVGQSDERAYIDRAAVRAAFLARFATLHGPLCKGR